MSKSLIISTKPVQRARTITEPQPAVEVRTRADSFGMLGSIYLRGVNEEDDITLTFKSAKAAREVETAARQIAEWFDGMKSGVPEAIELPGQAEEPEPSESEPSDPSGDPSPAS